MRMVRGGCTGVEPIVVAEIPCRLNFSSRMHSTAAVVVAGETSRCIPPFGDH